MPFLKSGLVARQYRNTLWLIWLAALALVLLFCWHVVNLTTQSQQQQYQTAERDLANLTRVSQEHANRTFRSADQVIRFVQARYLAEGSKLDLTDLTRRGVIDAEIFNQVGVIDTKGIYVLANRPVTGKLDLSDREHFRVHVAADTGELFVSKPVVGRATGKWSIQLTRRINRPNGDFAGVVVVSIDPTYFTRFCGELKLGIHGMTGLYGLDGIGRARRVDNREEFGSVATDSPLFALIRQGQAEGSYTRRSVVDQIERLYYYRKIPGYPLAVVAGLDAKDMLANYQLGRNALWQQAVMLIALTVALAAALTRYLSNIQRAMLARLSAQKQVLERTEQLDAVFALSPDGFISFDAERRVKFVNLAFSQMTDLGNHRLEGMDEHDFSAWLSSRCVPGAGFSGLAALRAKQHKGQADVRELIEIKRPGRRVLQVGMRCQGNSSVSQILYLRDVTVETEVDAMKSEFMATAAHELRTPMTSILGFTELVLLTDVDPAAQREYLQIVLSQANIMVSILDELLDLARIEARRGKDFRYTLVDIKQLMTDIVKALPLPAGRLAPVVTLPAEPLSVMADARKLQQALSNVLTNAYKYSASRGAAGTVTFAVCAGSPQAQSPAQVCICVTDNGIGMSADQVSQVFDRFYRADTSGKYLGTGLGMSIVKEIIDLHHGAIRIDSTPGQGTCVELCLPSHAGVSSEA